MNADALEWTTHDTIRGQKKTGTLCLKVEKLGQARDRLRTCRSACLLCDCRAHMSASSKSRFCRQCAKPYLVTSISGNRSAHCIAKESSKTQALPYQSYTDCDNRFESEIHIRSALLFLFYFWSYSGTPIQFRHLSSTCDATAVCLRL